MGNGLLATEADRADLLRMWKCVRSITRRGAKVLYIRVARRLCLASWSVVSGSYTAALLYLGGDDGVRTRMAGIEEDILTRRREDEEETRRAGWQQNDV